MKPLPIKRALSEDTRLSSAHLESSVLLDLHRDPHGEPIYYFTERGNPDDIYMMVDAELWSKIFE